MRQQLRQRPTAPQEQREKIQYLRRNDYREEAQAYFEHLIVEVNEANDWKWTFKPQGTKDVQDLADESLAAEPAVKEVAIELNLLPVSSPSCPRPYDTDERASSPLAEDVYARGMQVLKERAPALGLMSVDEFKATRRVLSGGSAEEVKLSKVLKDVLRSYDKADHLGGPVEQLEVQPVIQPLLSTLMDSETLNLCPTNSSKTQYSLDDGSNNGGYVMDGNQCGQGENEGSEESDEEVDEEKQWVEKELFERQRQGYGDEEEEEEDEELLLHRDRGAAIAPFAVEEEPTADYSNYSGHAGDESNSDSDHDKSNNTISITTAATVANNIPINEYHSFS
ncbi:hypothetical protein BC939DRAFT_440616 [Gamsiella multidivaricata]|uniref:uncharacterized protein n=1 Tax=Gamsiella multidivaricata TaxID=101098 RepID=UPI0022203355|nr:uncharacterized protein BC939DRAFT_440616 [Gamsiella multidivaricata]KAI7829795.1 hypothetical protein BC939DRAFT_440616 [Gamsiella multidivaricata]